MTHNTQPQKRRLNSLRLSEFDYAQPGAYFITICTHHHQCLFGEIQGETMHPNQLGEAVMRTWRELPRHYPYIELGAFCLMPDHVHGIIVIKAEGERIEEPTALVQVSTVEITHGLEEIVRNFKSFSARGVNKIRRTPGIPVWQRGYYDHVIRDEKDMQNTTDYIITNPERWKKKS